MVILYRLEYQRMDEINEVYWVKKSVNKEWLCQYRYLLYFKRIKLQIW